jgi:hypothetical protein
MSKSHSLIISLIVLIALGALFANTQKQKPEIESKPFPKCKFGGADFHANGNIKAAYYPTLSSVDSVIIQFDTSGIPLWIGQSGMGRKKGEWKRRDGGFTFFQSGKEDFGNGYLMPGCGTGIWKAECDFYQSILAANSMDYQYWNQLFGKAIPLDSIALNQVQEDSSGFVLNLDYRPPNEEFELCIFNRENNCFKGSFHEFNGKLYVSASQNKTKLDKTDLSHWMIFHRELNLMKIGRFL